MKTKVGGAAQLGAMAPKPESLAEQEALSRWGTDGGRAADEGLEGGERTAPSPRPALPEGFEGQPAWGFSDRSRRFSFIRVYGPPSNIELRGPLGQLDEALSYWQVTWPGAGATAEDPPESRWLNFAQAQKASRSHLSFEAFSSPRDMVKRLADFLDLPELPSTPLAAPFEEPLPDLETRSTGTLDPPPQRLVFLPS